MNIVLLSGGSGKRLWPMSNDSRSKQFLKVLQNDFGEPVSMLQRVWSQLEAAGLQARTFICAPKAQHDMIESQLGHAAVIEEPARRDTFPAIALSAVYLTDIEGCSDDDVMAVLPVDPFVDDAYFATVRRLEDVVHASGAEMVLMGVKPTEPSSSFGYIRLESTPASHGSLSWYRVDSFVEKPATPVAQQLLSEGALWNCGVFCFRISFLKRKLAELGYPTSYLELVTMFHLLPKRSFDYEVVERTADIAVVPYAGMWSDLGTWGALSNEIGNALIGRGTAIGCEQTHIINELGIPLVAMGLQNTMIVSTPDGILVADKEQAASIKDVIAQYSSRPMFEERRWGSYRVLDYQKLEDGTEVLTKCIELLPGYNISYQKHLKRSEVWTIIQGTGEFVVESKMVTVAAGDVIRVHPGQWHALRANDKLMFIEVQSGSELVEEDIIRRYLTWPEIVQHCLVVV